MIGLDEPGLGNMHTKQKGRPGSPGGIAKTGEEAKLGRFGKSFEEEGEGDLLEEVEEPKSDGFEEIGPSATTITSTAVDKVGKIEFEGTRGAGNLFCPDDGREADSSLSCFQPIGDMSQREEGGGGGDVKVLLREPTVESQDGGIVKRELTIDSQDGRSLKPPWEGGALGGADTAHWVDDDLGAGRILEDDIVASRNLEVPRRGSQTSLSQTSQSPSKPSSRPRPSRLQTPSPPKPSCPTVPPSAPSSKSSYSAVPMAGLPLAGAVCGLCLGGPVVRSPIKSYLQIPSNQFVINIKS